MQFEDQSAAMRQMKELLRDQAKFRAKLDRVVRKIETSSERTAKLAERNRLRSQKGVKTNGDGNGDGDGHGKIKNKGTGEPRGDARHDGDGEGESHEMEMAGAGTTSGPEVS
jgi:hypothetical protein